MLLAGVLVIFCFLPRAQDNPALRVSIGLAATALLLFAVLLRQHVVASRRSLTVELLPRRVHYVQLVMHSCLYAYWGWYWREVYHYVPLILVQIIYAYALDMLLCWSRRDRWIAGFGPIPIILSTNLFLWFRDDWFFLQFVMISIGVVAKEFVTWQRDGRRTHIFNPSAVGLFLFSVVLIATHSTSITWGEQIAQTLHRPPNIYLEIFVLGLVVQALFSVTLVTLSAAAVLCLMNVIYTHATGVYQFIDSYIPVSVFIGLHLLVTDPATSPKSNSGKIIFGGLYGASVFGLYSLLTLLGAPRFYDKLLCVPPLNLSVRVLDWVGVPLDHWAAIFFQRLKAPRFVWGGSPRQTNFAFMSLWIVLFSAMMTTGFVETGIVGKSHPGADPAFWEKACDAHLHKACPTWVGMLNAECEQGGSSACLTMANVTNMGLAVPREPATAARGFGRACDLGESGACTAFRNFISNGGDQTLAHSCDRGDAYSCFYLATVLHLGQGLPQDEPRAIRVFEESCDRGYVRACGVLGEMYLLGQGIPVDGIRALKNFERSCAGHFGDSCVSAAMLYHRGVGGIQDEELSQRRFQQGCELGYEPACRFLQSSALR
jgi:TPR repeat protein/Na+-translocating ferredoxin:NAD+ oxidoreductase RnfD subunit